MRRGVTQSTSVLVLRQCSTADCWVPLSPFCSHVGALQSLLCRSALISKEHMNLLKLLFRSEEGKRPEPSLGHNRRREGITKINKDLQDLRSEFEQVQNLSHPCPGEA